MLGKNHYETLEDNEKQTLLVDIRSLQFLLHALNNLRKRSQMSLVDHYLENPKLTSSDGLSACVMGFLRLCGVSSSVSLDEESAFESLSLASASSESVKRSEKTNL